MHRLFTFLALAVALFPLLWTTACAPRSQDDHAVQMGNMSDLPAAMAKAPARVRDSYRYAMTNPEPLQNVPCYCGCGPLGHNDNYDCYIKGTDANGKFIFDDHALGCQICVEITQDVLRYTKSGMSPEKIRAAIDKTYSPRGPSNMQ